MENGAIDDYDDAILLALQDDAGQSNKQLAERVGLSETACSARVKKLREKGYIKEIVAILDHDLMGFDVTCIVAVNTHNHVEAADESGFAEYLQAVPQVLVAYKTFGSYDFFLKIRVAKARELDQVIDDIRAHPYVRLTTTYIVARSYKDTSKVDWKKQRPPRPVPALRPLRTADEE